jgi:hypothetical protein
MYKSTLVGGELSASRPGRFTSGERVPGSHWIGRWVGPRAGLDDVEKRKFLTLPGFEHLPSVFQPVASRYTDYAALIIVAESYFCSSYSPCQLSFSYTLGVRTTGIGICDNNQSQHKNTENKDETKHRRT